ncbi:MAG: protein-glutamate O-methyltransferase CheR [Lachnospiraceae bacterium]|nr:protein-glutamate O-methyltransferase CheR [Lachnospiraceae bacterium]
MDYEQFKKQVYRLTHIDLNSYKERQMKRRIDVLMQKNKFHGYDEYVHALKNDKNLYEEFVGFITINVSEFYRNPEQWRILEEEILPDLLKKTNRRLNVWSAACSTGDEPYSLAMLLLDYIPKNNIRILATDLDGKVLNKAQEGIYNFKSMSNLPSKYIDQYFVKIDDKKYQIKNLIKECVRFEQHDLLEDNYPKNFDLIICRNVVIYFTDEAKTKIYQKFNDSMNSDGILFVGSTEQIVNYKELNYDSLKSFFYKKN